MPKERDLAPGLPTANPSAASPRFSNSRTAAARLGMRWVKRKSSSARNSIKHVFSQAKGTRLDISLRRRGDRAELAIADDGPGFPDTASAGAPSGLGLSILLSFASRLGGEISMEAAAGAVVRVAFPVIRSHDRPAPMPRPDASLREGGLMPPLFHHS
jgi:hypothetical protein